MMKSNVKPYYALVLILYFLVLWLNHASVTEMLVNYKYGLMFYDASLIMLLVIFTGLLAWNYSTTEHLKKEADALKIKY